jgi:hypothetical protein
MSLWSVQDRATRDWMVALYPLRLLEHVDTPQAVRHASLTLLRDRKAKGVSTHPVLLGRVRRRRRLVGLTSVIGRVLVALQRN